MYFRSTRFCPMYNSSSCTPLRSYRQSDTDKLADCFLFNAHQFYSHTYFTQFQNFTEVFIRKHKCSQDHWLQKLSHCVHLRKLQRQKYEQSCVNPPSHLTAFWTRSSLVSWFFLALSSSAQVYDHLQDREGRGVR